MLRILVCFKIVHDLESVIPEDWKTAADTSFRVDYTKYIFNCFDEAALETALCIKDELRDVEITALTVNAPEAADTFISHLYAVGVDKVVQLSEDRDLHFAPETVAAGISDYLSREHFDAVFTGSQASVGNSGLVPPLLAAMTGRTFLHNVYDVHFSEESWQISCILRDEFVTLSVQSAILCSFDTARHAYLRIPTLRERLRAKNCRPLARTMEASSIKESYSIVSLAQQRQDRQKNLIGGETSAEKVETLLSIVNQVEKET